MKFYYVNIIGKRELVTEEWVRGVFKRKLDNPNRAWRLLLRGGEVFLQFGKVICEAAR